MTCKGHIRNGSVVLDEHPALPDGTEVRVEPVAAAARKTRGYRRFRVRLLAFAGTMQDMPPDMARNHDHYLYGTPRK